MNQLVILLNDREREVPCALCGTGTVAGIGAQLVLARNFALVCRGCGRKDAPVLEALVNLAQVAERVGHISRYTRQWLPVKELLDLTRASEDFFEHLTGERRGT